MAGKFDFHIFIDNSKDLAESDRQLVNGIVEKLGPAIEQKARTTTLYYLQPDAGPSSFDVPANDPVKLAEKVYSLTPGDNRDDFDQLVKSLKDVHLHKPHGLPQSNIYITNGDAPERYEERLSRLIDETMIRVAARGGNTIPVGTKQYRPCGVTFVQFGGNQKAKGLFERLDAVDGSVQKKFEECLKHGSDELYRHANEAYEKLGTKDKQYYCKKTLDIVDYVEIKSTTDLDERKLEKIMFGAIDPDRDEVNASNGQ